MKHCYILVGPPGAGKSTWIEKTFQGEGYVISTDAILEEIAAEAGITYDEAWQLYNEVVVKMMHRRMDAAVDEMWNPIVVDRTNMSVKARRQFIEFFKRHGYRFTAVVFPAPPAEEWERRLANRPGKTIPKGVIRSMLQSFVMPTKEEGFDDVFIVEEDIL